MSLSGNVVRWDYLFASGWSTRSLSVGSTQDDAKSHSFEVSAGVVVWFRSDFPNLAVLFYQGKEILPSKILEWGDLQEEVNRLARLVPFNNAEVEGVAAEVLCDVARKKLAAFFQAIGHPDPEKGAGLQPTSTSSTSTPAEPPEETLPP